MKEIFRSNDLVRLSWVEALLKEAGIESLRLDRHASIMEGSISVIQQRIMVLEEDYQLALRRLQEGLRDLEEQPHDLGPGL